MHLALRRRAAENPGGCRRFPLQDCHGPAPERGTGAECLFCMPPATDRSNRGSRTLLRLSEAGQNLVIDYPAWPGLLMIGLGVALAVHLARRFEWNRQTFGVTAATAVLLYGGLYFLTYKVTLTPDGGRAYALPGLSRSIQWSHVVSVATEERHGRGTATWIVIYTATGAGLEIKVTGLSGVDEHRLRKYIAARVKQ